MEVGNININFSIFSDDPLCLQIADLSEWVYAEQQPSYILITLPGYKNPKTFAFNKFKINRFNSHNLGLSCLSGDCTEEHYIDLPDGIYQVCVKSNYEGIERSRFYLKTDLFKLEYAKVAVKYEKEDLAFLQNMIFIKGLLEVAESHAMLGDFAKAHRFFEEAKEKLRKYITCKDCI